MRTPAWPALLRTQLPTAPALLGPWAGFGVFCLYAVAALAAGFVLIRHRDA